MPGAQRPLDTRVAETMMPVYSMYTVATALELYVL